MQVQLLFNNSSRRSSMPSSFPENDENENTVTATTRRPVDRSFHGWFSDHEADDDEDDPEFEEGDSAYWNFQAKDIDMITPNSSIGSINPLEVPSKKAILSLLPVEIIDHITRLLRNPTYHGLDVPEQFISRKYSDFSDARFHLSALSQVSSAFRPLAEHVLYRDIQLDITGWKGRKHPQWPAGSLKLLLRTLTARPDLARLIHTANIDWQSHTGSEEAEEGLASFLEFTPNLSRFYISCCPGMLWQLNAMNNITTFATSYDHDIIVPILQQFPNLTKLVLLPGVHGLEFPPPSIIPNHKVSTLRLVNQNNNAVNHLIQAFRICGESVRVLELEYLGALLNPTPQFHHLKMAMTPPACAFIHTLTLNGISVLSHPSAGPATILQNMEALRVLSLRHHDAFAIGAFSALPRGLSVLTIVEYYGRWERERDNSNLPREPEDDFMIALGVAISGGMQHRAPSIVNVETSTDESINTGIGDVKSLREACNGKNIPFVQKRMEVPIIRIRFR